MKKLFFPLLLFLLTSTPTFAHYLWLETQGQGILNKEHQVKVFYGEYTYGIIEAVKGEAFPLVAKFKLWVVTPDGTKTELITMAKDNYYLASFTPKEKGVYTVVLNNNEIDVLDYTEWDFGIFKTHYHSTSRVVVDEGNANTAALNSDGIAVKQLNSEDDQIKLQVLFKNTPLKEYEFKVFVADQWSKTLYTDENGEVTFSLPWKTKYIVEATQKEEIPGTYNGKDYEFIWHCATFCLL